MEPAIATNEHPVCSLCGASGVLDTELVRCVSSSAWELSWEYTDSSGYVKKVKRTSQETSDPQEWNVCLCQDCQVAQYIEADAAKAKKNAGSILQASVGALIGGAISGGMFYLTTLVHAPTSSPAYQQLDQRAVDKMGPLLFAVFATVAVIVFVVCLVQFPILLLARIRRRVLTGRVRRDRKVSGNQRLVSFSQAAKCIASRAESCAEPTDFRAFPLPRVPTAADCSLKLPEREHSLEMTKQCRVIEAQYDGHKWENRDDSIW